ncbi:MAG: Flp pilus assembly complex ATPase component TadA [Firmicutes bacterium]|nr:Flp pilus assembly complex ATPase component TadA [Bacillota bacterium]
MTASREPLFKTLMLNRDMTDFLKECVQDYYNIFVCGLPGSGKTSLLNLLASFIPVGELIAVIEDRAELRLPLHTIRQLVIGGVKDMNRRKIVKELGQTGVRRIVLGDCAKGEAYEILRAMSGSLNGSMAAAMAYDPADLLNFQLPGMVASIGFGLKKDEVLKLVAEAVDLVVFMKEQRVEQIAKVTGTEKQKSGLAVTLHPIYVYDREQNDWIHQPPLRPAW